MDEDYEDRQQTQHDDMQAIEENKRKIKYAYSLLDRDASGELTYEELRKGLQLIGLNPTKEYVKDLMIQYNTDGGKKRRVTFEEFEEILSKEILKDEQAVMLEAFRVFDTNKDGTLDKNEFKKCMTTLGQEQLTDEEVAFFFDQLDVDHDGKLQLVEAAKLLTC